MLNTFGFLRNLTKFEQIWRSSSKSHEATHNTGKSRVDLVRERFGALASPKEVLAVTSFGPRSNDGHPSSVMAIQAARTMD